MTQKLDPALRALLTRIAARHPSTKLPFLVTLAPGEKVAGLVPPLPFAPTLEVDSIRLAAGEMTARQALDLAAQAQVERIEHDGRADALEALADRD